MKVEKCVSLGPHGHGQIPTVGLGTFTVFGQRVRRYVYSPLLKSHIIIKKISSGHKH